MAPSPPLNSTLPGRRCTTEDPRGHRRDRLGAGGRLRRLAHDGAAGDARGRAEAHGGTQQAQDAQDVQGADLGSDRQQGGRGWTGVRPWFFPGGRRSLLGWPGLEREEILNGFHSQSWHYT